MIREAVSPALAVADLIDVENAEDV